jgi:hypothetical protein
VIAEILICVVQRKPVSLRFTAPSEHEYDGVRYDANSLFWQVISKRFRREPFNPNLSPYVVDFETADVPMPVFVSARASAATISVSASAVGSTYSHSPWTPQRTSTTSSWISDGCHSATTTCPSSPCRSSR